MNWTVDLTWVATHRLWYCIATMPCGTSIKTVDLFWLSVMSHQVKGTIRNSFKALTSAVQNVQTHHVRLCTQMVPKTLQDIKYKSHQIRYRHKLLHSNTRIIKIE